MVLYVTDPLMLPVEALLALPKLQMYGSASFISFQLKFLNPPRVQKSRKKQFWGRYKHEERFGCVFDLNSNGTGGSRDFCPGKSY